LQNAKMDMANSHPMAASFSSIMLTLYDALLGQHARQLKPVRCARSTIAQLHRYFEDVVLENNLNALVVENLPTVGKQLNREKARVRELARGHRRAFFLISEAEGFKDVVGPVSASEFPPVILQHTGGHHADEHFVLIADSRFSALLATVRGRAGIDTGDDVIWTFEPDIVYSALEFMMSRMAAEHPYHSATFEAAVRESMPKATSLQLTLSVTTKLAHLLQEQAGREIAVNRIATAIRESVELGVILQKTVDEVATALNVAYCALRLESQTGQKALTYFHDNNCEDESARREEISAELDVNCAKLAMELQLVTGDADDEGVRRTKLPLALAPLIFHERLMGALLVMTEDHKRVWQENELLLLRTVADQVAVAVNHANLFAQIQQQALTDPLTGCHNRRSFEMQLDRDLLMARRLHQPLSLLMVDLDCFKQLNDTVGHDAGDDALRKLTEGFLKELRGVDTSARFGGDEFALILPQADSEGATLVAERLRARIEQIEIPGFGNLSASIGVASFPADASSRAELVRTADAALYEAKRSGRNQVCAAENSQTKRNDHPVVPASESNSLSESTNEPLICGP